MATLPATSRGFDVVDVVRSQCQRDTPACVVRLTNSELRRALGKAKRYAEIR
jgi:hypothetical protein